MSVHPLSAATGTPGVTFHTNPGANPLRKRYKVRFPSREAYEAARSAELPTLYWPAVESRKRAFMSLAIPVDTRDLAGAARNEAQTLTLFEREFGARIVEDVRYDMEATELFDAAEFQPADAAQASLDEVLATIRATECWGQVRGEGIVIAVVDTGIDGSRPEFPGWKRAGGWAAVGEDPWTDWNGHGTMCGVIAAGSRESGGIFDGVAPAAGVMACRTHFFDSELAAVYDELASRAKAGTRIIATNSFGTRTGSPPPPPEDSDFIPALNDAIAAGVTAFFSAGNYHELAGGAADGCDPTSIWLHKCRSDVMSVGTCKLDQSMWSYSSRGPGQHHAEPHCNRKPDVMAPTPAYGRIVYGSDVVVLANGWGTSGACPQAAGLGALLLEHRPGLAPAALFDVIRSTAVRAGHGPDCEGAGMIDCRAALDAA